MEVVIILIILIEQNKLIAEPQNVLYSLPVEPDDGFLGSK